MEELQKTQEYAAERERRRMQQRYEGDDRRKPGAQEPVIVNLAVEHDGPAPVS